MRNNEQGPLVSVLMTCYNREKYIGNAIESVLCSVYENFELIIVDDASADNTVNIAKSYAAKDARISVYINEENLSDYPNRNLAVSYAKGKYLKYVDSDDYIYPHGLEVLVKSMEMFPEAGLGFCSLQPDRSRPFPFMLRSGEAYEYHFFGAGLFHKGPLSVIFRRDAFNEVSGFKPGRMISDIDMWHRMALKYPVVLMQDGLVWQRRHDEQELNDKHRFIYPGEKIKWEYLKAPECTLSVAQLRQIKKQRLKRYAGFILSGIKKLNFQQVKIYGQCWWYVANLSLKK